MSRQEYPLRDVRVRRALYHAVDIEAIKSRVMRREIEDRRFLCCPRGRGFDPTVHERLSFDPNTAKKLLVDAGYPEGFEIGFDAPNDRYVNDEKIAQAIVPMWAKIGVRAKLMVQPGSALLKKGLCAGNPTSGWVGRPLSHIGCLPFSLVEYCEPTGKAGHLQSWRLQEHKGG